MAQPPRGAEPMREPERLLRRLEWTVLRRLDGLLQGDYRTLFRGFGLDLADLREYRHGDDVRRLDWNATARLGEPYVRQFQEDREVAAWFVLDLSGSVDFGSGAVTKRAQSAAFTGLLARLLTRHGNRAGALVYGAGVEATLPARSDRRHVLHLLDRVLDRGTARPVNDPAGLTRLQELLQAADRTVRRRSVVFVVSDFISAPGWERALAQLAQRHETVAVRLVDPLERDLPDLGLITLQDAETGEQLLVDTHDARLRRRFQAAAQAREDRLRDAFAAAGVDALELSTDEDVGDAVLRFAALRRMQGRRGGRYDGVAA